MSSNSYSNRKLTHFNQYPYLLQHFLNYDGAIENKSIDTVKSYAYDLEFFLKYMVYIKSDEKEYPDISSIDISMLDEDFFKKITREDILEYLFYLQSERRNAPRTRYRRLVSVKAFFNYLHTHKKVIDNNPAYDIDSPKLDKKLPKYLTFEECIQLLSNIDSTYYERDYCMIVLFLNGGIRLSELVNINLTDIRSDNTLRVTGKGSKERTVYLTDASIDAINRYLNVRLDTEHPIIDKNALFISPKTGQRVKKRRVQQIVSSALKSAHLDGLGLSTHKLRHTAATMMFQNGVDVRTLKEVLGHENLSTTEIYTHLNTTQLQEAAQHNPLGNVKIEKIE